ncbi:MAG: hypothetical protein ACP5J0_06360, partial [Pyrobaculum sp.]
MDLKTGEAVAAPPVDGRYMVFGGGVYLRGGYGVNSVLYPFGFSLRVGLDPSGLGRAGRWRRLTSRLSRCPCPGDGGSVRREHVTYRLWYSSSR